MKNLNVIENEGKDLVARVLSSPEEGGVPHDVDVSYLVRQGGVLFGKDSVSEEEVMAELNDENTYVYFVRFEEAGEWSML